MLFNRKNAVVLVAVLALGACSESDGQRCNPLAYSNSGTTGDCKGGLSCVYPTAPNCGVAYCCVVDTSGNITDPHPHCQPDTSLASVCMLDLSSAPSDSSIATPADMTPAD